MANVDQRGFDNQRSRRRARPSEPPEAPFLTGREAAALLGVKRETLYAYASRGLVRSEPGAGPGRERRYHREDLERLRARRDARSGHGPVAASALRWGEPVLETAISMIAADGPRYRGHLATRLAETSTFEAVTELLWSGALPDRAPPPFHAGGLGLRPASLAALLPRSAPPLSILALAIPALAAADPDRAGAAVEAERRRARALILRMAALLAVADPSRAREAVASVSVARALLIALGTRPTARAERAVDSALVLAADHELNPSTFTVRIAASAGSDLYACVSAGIATLSGPRHGGSVDRVEALVAEIGRPERARAIIQDRARRGDSVPGFGHPLYPGGDPRAPPLLASAVAIAPKSLEVRVLLALIEAMREAGREPPTIDAGLVAISAALGLPAGSGAAIFAIGRTAGWIAHAFEQREEGFLLRPRARYVGAPAR